MIKFKNIFAVFAILLSGCAMDTQGVSSEAGELPYTFSQFSDVPVPENAVMNLNRTAIFGRENDWLGKVVFTAPYSVGGVFDFYMDEMPKFGWSEITSVRGPNSVLTYARDSRIALIQLSPSPFQGTSVIFTMSPAPRNNKVVVKKPQSNMVAPAPVQTQKLMEPVRQPVALQPQQNLSNTDGDNVQSMSITDSSLFVSPSAKKALPGSLGLGDASNMNYKSNSNGVGQPPKFNY